MSPQQVDIQVIAVLTAIACALPGVFLVLRRMSLMSDAIGHVVLLGIALGFVATGDLKSIALIAGAAMTGVLTVYLVELLTDTRLVKQDAAIGLVFPALFSLGVIIISRYAGNVHLDIDAVLLGELAFAPYDRVELNGQDYGPRSTWVMGSILLLNLLFISAFYKELKLATFDRGLALALGFAPTLLHYLLMTLVSITAVGAFEAVGSILVVALMIAPPATASLLTDRLSRMLVASAAIAAIGSILGYWLSHALDASIAGCMASVLGVLFGAAFTFAPKRGLVAQARRRARQRLEFAQKMLAIHLLHHENRAEAMVENRVDHLSEHLRWSTSFAATVVRSAERKRLVGRREGDLLELTPAGRELAQDAVVHL